MGRGIVVLICAFYVLARSLGKYFGARWGSCITKENENIRKYLGFTLLPQAGVAIGMARSSSSTFRTIADTAANLSQLGIDYLYDIASIIPPTTNDNTISNKGIKITLMILISTATPAYCFAKT